MGTFKPNRDGQARTWWVRKDVYCVKEDVPTVQLLPFKATRSV